MNHLPMAKIAELDHSTTHWVQDVVATLNQFNIATTSCAQWACVARSDSAILVMDGYIIYT